MLKRYAIILLAGLTCRFAVAGDTTGLSISSPLSGTDVSSEQIQSVTVSASLSLPAFSYLAPLQTGESLSDISYQAVLGATAGRLSWEQQTPDIPTSENGRYSELEGLFQDGGKLMVRPVTIIGEVTIQDTRYAELLIFPTVPDSSGILRAVDSVAVFVGARQVSPDRVFERHKLLGNRSGRTGPYTAMADSASFDYVIITNRHLADAFQGLVRLKNETGFYAEVKLMEDIVAAYPGRDDAEKLREYLKEFYSSGGRYVLMGGDETVLPLRYAYHSNAWSQPAFDYLQICDLYFADMDGDWDADGDGIWGEPFDDAPDVIPELYIGRLPFSTPEQVLNYTQSLLRYLLSPGDDDPSYLTRTFFFSADQMRDLADGGQHGRIARSFPSYFYVDTTLGVEASSGDDPSPSNAHPWELSSQMAGGYGIVNIIAHGRSDGFAIKTSGYNQWPKEYLITQRAPDSPGSFASLVNPDRPGFYYSLACETGAFDYDQPPIDLKNQNMAELLLSLEGGAVGFIANSRWGWVSSSYRLQQAFFDSLFAHPGRPAIEAMYEVKQRFYYQRDLVYGQLFLGDPSLVVYTTVPTRPELDLSFEPGFLRILASANGQPLANADIVVTRDGNPIERGLTGTDGLFVTSYPFNPGQDYKVTAVVPGMTLGQALFAGSIVTSVEEQNNGNLPSSPVLSQNYPNPFNPSTTIAFELPAAEGVRLTVFNLLGQVVTTLVNEELPAGHHEVTWEPTEMSASGMYFYRLETSGTTLTRKMVFLK